MFARGNKKGIFEGSSMKWTIEVKDDGSMMAVTCAGALGNLPRASELEGNYWTSEFSTL